MYTEIDVKIRIRVRDDELQAAGITARHFAKNLELFEHGFDVSSIVLSQSETDPVENWRAAIVSAEILSNPEDLSKSLLGDPVDADTEIIFLHSFSKNGLVRAAQAYVCIRPDKIWGIRWREVAQDGSFTEELWREGKMDEILVAFRTCISEKLQQGYEVTDFVSSQVFCNKESELEWALAE